MTPEKLAAIPCPESFTLAQYSSQNGTIYEPIFTRSFSPGERVLLSYLNHRVWQKQNVVIRAGVPNFLVPNTGIASSTIKRHLKILIKMRLIECVQVDRDKGNHYLVEPILLPQFLWKKLPIKNIERSRLFQMVQNGPSQIMDKINAMVQNGPSDSLKRTILAQLSGTTMVQNGPQIYLLYSLLLADASRYASNNKSEGGEDDLTNKDDLGKRCPTDRSDQGELLQKGIGLAADEITKLIGVRALEAEMERRKKEREMRKSL